MVTQHDGFDISVFWSFFGVTVETQVLFVVEHEVDESQIYNESKNTFKKRSLFNCLSVFMIKNETGM